MIKLAAVGTAVALVAAGVVLAGTAPAEGRPRPPKPTTTTVAPPPTTTTVPPPPPGGCAFPAFPTASCTGVPAGTVITNTVTGDYTVTTPGQVIDGWHITGDLNINADGVVVRNTYVDGTVWNKPISTAYSYTITDSTVGPASGCTVAPGLNEANYTATRVQVRGHDDGFRFSDPGNVIIRDSFAKLCYAPPSVAPPDGSHSDGIQAFCPDATCAGLTFDHNTVDARGIPATFMVNLVDPKIAGAVDISQNLLGGGAYVMVPEWRTGPNWTVHDNAVIDRSWAYGPVSAENTCAHQDWQGNQLVNVDTGYAVTSVVAPLSCIN